MSRAVLTETYHHLKCKALPVYQPSTTMPRELSDPADRLFQRERSLSKHRIQSRFSFEFCREGATGSTSEQLAEQGIINKEDERVR